MSDPVITSATDINLYAAKPREIQRMVARCLEKGLVPFVKGSPGVGKTSLLRAIAQAMNLCLIDHRVAGSGPEDFNGLPDLNGHKAVMKPFDMFPTEGDELPINKETGKPYAGWLLHLSEFNAGLPMVTVAAYKLVLEREVGQQKLHPAVHIVCDGNADEDRAITQELGTAMKTRLIWLRMVLDGTKRDHFDDFMYDVAIPQNWDNRIIAFLHHKPEYLNNFKADSQEDTQAVPRTWDFAQKLAQDYDISINDAPLFAGALGASVGAELVAFADLFTKVPNMDDVINDPLAVDVPNDPGIQWATISSAVSKAAKDNIDPIGDFVERFPLTFRILFWRLAQLQKPEIRQTGAFRRAFVGVGRYLYTDS